MSKKKKLLENTSYSKNSLNYYNYWLKLFDCREEYEYDETRKELNKLWSLLNQQEKNEFKILSDNSKRLK